MHVQCLTLRAVCPNPLPPRKNECPVFPSLFQRKKLHVPSICLQMLDQVGDPTAPRCRWHCLKCCIMRLVQFLSVSILGIYKAPITLVPKQFEKCTHPRRGDEIQTEAQVQSSRGRAREAPPAAFPLLWSSWPPCCGQGTSPPTCLSAGRDGAPALPPVQLRWWAV